MASISHALSQLEKKDYVKLLVNEDRRKERVYGLTDTVKQFKKTSNGSS